MNYVENEKSREKLCEMNISLGVLKEMLHLKDNVHITDIYMIRNRNLIKIVLHSDEHGKIVETGDIRPVVSIKTVQKIM